MSRSELFLFPAGLIDSCVEQLKQTHSQLHLESVQPGKASHRKKVSRHWLEISSLGVSLPLFCVFFPLNKITVWSQFLDKYYEYQCSKRGVFNLNILVFLFIFFIFLYYQEEGHLKEVKLNMEILRSALYRNDECKVSLCVCLLIPHC